MKLGAKNVDESKSDTFALECDPGVFYLTGLQAGTIGFFNDETNTRMPNVADDSRDVVASYADERIRMVVNEEPIGLTRSLNRGIALARGVYLARMDAGTNSDAERAETRSESGRRVDRR